MGSATLDWNHVRTFLAIAQEGSFSAAGRRLGLTQPSVGRQVAALEESLGVVLFERNRRGTSLTPNGVELVDHARRMRAAADDLELVATGQSTALEGPVRLTASEAVAAFLLPPIVEETRRLYPGISVEIIATHQTTDLHNREADIAIRNTRPSHPQLVSRRLPDLRTRLYATPEYLGGYGRTPEQLGRATFLGFARDEVLIRDLKRFGLSLTQANFPVISHSHLVQWELAKRGQGVGLMLEVVGDEEPAVRRALSNDAVFLAPTYLVCHRELRTTRRLRAVFDLLAQWLGGEASQAPGRRA